MAVGLIYRSPLIYEAAMIGLYGRHYFARYRAIADLILPESSVLDLCCGPAILYSRYLRHKSVDYTGLDINANFIKRLTERGVRAQTWDLQNDKPLPPADYVIMQASLYHFLPEPLPLLSRMIQAAGKQVIISEPVRNLNHTKIPLVVSLTQHLTNPGDNSHSFRFTEETLDDLFVGLCSGLPRAFLINGGREKIYVIHARSKNDERRERRS